MPKPILLDRTYDDALALLLEVRNHFADGGPWEGQAPFLEERVILLYVGMQLTTWLTDAMGWLLMQKAIHAGEICIPEHRRLAADASRWRAHLDSSAVPVGLRRLLDRSSRLHSRIERLDRLIDAQNRR